MLPCGLYALTNNTCRGPFSVSCYSEYLALNSISKIINSCRPVSSHRIYLVLVPGRYLLVVVQKYHSRCLEAFDGPITRRSRCPKPLSGPLSRWSRCAQNPLAVPLLGGPAAQIRSGSSLTRRSPNVLQYVQQHGITAAIRYVRCTYHIILGHTHAQVLDYVFRSSNSSVSFYMYVPFRQKKM